MARTKDMQFANFICKFGQSETFLDYPKIVLNAFFHKEHERAYGNTKYLVRNTGIFHGDTNIGPCLFGRFIKIMQHTREQVFVNEQIIHNKDYLDDAPTALFFIFLNDHRMCYIHETSNAPSLHTFQATLLRFLKTSRRAFCDIEFDAKKTVHRKDNSLLKKQIEVKIPIPTLEITPLSSKQSFSEFLRKFWTLKKINIKLIDTNNEFDTSELFQGLRDLMEDLEGNKTTIEYSNPEGLNKETAAKQMSPLLSTGNHWIKLQGLDEDGARIAGNNMDFSLKLAIPSSKIETIEAALMTAYDNYGRLIENGDILLPQKYDSTPSKLSSFLHHANTYTQ